MSAAADKLVSLGRVAGVFGIKGWIKVYSYTEPRESIVNFQSWRLRTVDESASEPERNCRLEAGRMHGKQVIAKLVGVDDRDEAATLVGMEIGVPRSALPPCEDDTYYWVDLVGLTVRNARGDMLGTVDRMLETGVHDVMVLDREGQRMIPFVRNDIVQSVDLEKGVITVDWELSYWDQ